MYMIYEWLIQLLTQTLFCCITKYEVLNINILTPSLLRYAYADIISEYLNPVFIALIWAIS